MHNKRKVYAWERIYGSWWLSKCERRSFMRRRKLLGRVIAFAMSLAIFGAECGSIPAMAAVSATGIESEIDASVDDVEQYSEVTNSEFII